MKRLCHHAILLEHGHVVYAGKPNDVVNLYSKLTIDGTTADALQKDIAALNAKSHSTIGTGNANTPASNDSVTDSGLLPADPRAEALLSDERDHVQLSGHEFSYGGELGRIQSVAALDAAGQPRTWFTTGERVTLRMVAEAFEDLHEPIFALTVKNTAGVEIYGTNTLFSQQPAPAMKTGERREVEFAFDLNLMAGHYFLSFGFTHFVGDKLVVLHRRYDAIKIDVHSVDRTFGIANLKAIITSRTAS